MGTTDDRYKNYLCDDKHKSHKFLVELKQEMIVMK